MAVGVVPLCFGLVLVAEAHSTVAPDPVPPVVGRGTEESLELGVGLLECFLDFFLDFPS